MADVAAVDQTVSTHTETTVAAPARKAPVDRSALRAAAIKKIQANQATEGDERAAAVAVVERPAAEKPAEPNPSPSIAKTAEAKAEAPDPATERGLRTLEQAKKKWMDEQAAKNADLDVRIAKIAQREKEIEGKATSAADLEKSPLLSLLDQRKMSEEEWEAVSRAAYARTKAGKADPRAALAVQEAERSQASRAQAGTVAELQAKIEQLEQKLLGEFTKRDQATFAERWIGEAVKAAPTDKPSFFNKALATEPETARRELLTIGAELEKANDGEAPTHAEVLAEFEKRKRAQLKALGLDPDTLLIPAAAAKAAPRTLEVGATGLTRATTKPESREERRAIAIKNLRDRMRTTADQT